MALPHLLRRWRDRWTPRRGDGAVTRQFGAIPYAVVDGRVMFLMVTSRRTGRWIFPKGSEIAGMAPWQVAAHEAYEEAGIEGEIETVPIGAYRDTKTIGFRRVTIEVDLFPLRLVRQLEHWPEQSERHRHWVMLPEARRRLANPRLGELAALLDRRVAAPPAAPPPAAPR